MMKRKFTVILLCLIFGLAACAKENIPVSEENVPVTESVKPEENQDEENLKDDEGWSASGLSQLLADTAISLKNGTALSGLTVVGEDSPYYCNLEENMRGGDYTCLMPLLVCKDPVYDITYYVNYGEDYYIYAKQKDSVTCVLEIPANQLYCRGGELYFAVESFDNFTFEGIEQGNVLKYNPLDGTVEMVIDANTEEMVVYPDGITYDIRTFIEAHEDGTKFYNVKRYFYSFETGETVEYEVDRQLERWKEYWLVELVEGGVYLEDLAGEKVRDLENMDKLPDWFYIKDDRMYYLGKTVIEESNRRTLVIYDFVTGEKTESILGRNHTMSDLMLQGDVLYFGSCFRVSLQDGTQHDVKFSKGYKLENMHSDGESMYCTFSGKLWRLEAEQVKERGFEVMTSVGIPVGKGCYEYKLYEPGHQEPEM